MKTQDIKNMGLAMQQVQEASAVGADGAISGRDDDPAVQAARKKMRADHAAKKAAKMAAHKMAIRKASGKSGKPDLSGASLDQLKAILKAKNSDRNKPKNEQVEVQEAAGKHKNPMNQTDYDKEAGIVGNAKKEKDRTSGVGVDANKSIDLSFKSFKAMNKKAPHNGNRTPPGDTAIVKSTTAPAANQKTEGKAYGPTGVSYSDEPNLQVKSVGNGVKKGKPIKGTIQPPKKVGSQVDELSKGTMGSYVKRATSDNAVNNMAKGMAMATGNKNMKDQASKLSKKRKAGIATAVDKMVKKEAMDPVGQADADIDNDGDVDKADSYLRNRRKAIGKKMKNKGKGKVGEKAVMHGGKSGEKKNNEVMAVGEEK